MKLKNIFLLSVATVALTACDDLFEPAIENNQDITKMYTDATFARGIMDNANLVLPYEENPTNMTDVATDDAVSNDIDNNYKKMASQSIWTSQNNPINQWETRYHAIQYLNLFLENADKVRWDYSSEALNVMHNDNYKGNAYALRGLHFFYLLRAHCGMVNGQLMGVPIHLTSEDGTSDFNLPRNTFKECIDQIMADFDEALKYLPQEYGDVSASNVPAKYTQIGATDGEYNRAFGRLQRGKIDGRMIAAFKAQVALFAASPAYASAGAMSYEDAAKYAAASLANIGGISGMDPNGWRWYCDVDMIESFAFDDADPAEICWRGVVGDSHSLEESNYPPSLMGKGRVNPTQNLVDAFPMANGYPISAAASGYDAKNPYENRDPRLKTYILVNGDAIGVNNTAINTAADNNDLDGINRESGKSTVTGFYLRKLLRNDVNLNPAADKRHFGARIRYTEIFLDYAEAANEAAGPKTAVGGASYSAYDVIKAIRQRAGVGGANDPYLEECAQSQEKMRELIRNERRLELCFENHRFWDLRRWKANLNEGAKGVEITTSTDGALIFKTIDVEPRSFKDYMYYGPIPYSEIRKWSNLQQNDGWTNAAAE
ncbi:MAG: RagB/SusD family nutrient uptake outer membrane protein [Prevotella sp.]|nr:RagB/SusD family nutrient uptake outer membrane protein [Prevotella sp.]MBR1556836.1 RagB/SusD family nutrient uptake outer membrane protein [Prevotella sp.]